jgi:DNA invertase Pin-like site-specific DNA recombinase
LLRPVPSGCLGTAKGAGSRCGHRLTALHLATWSIHRRVRPQCLHRPRDIGRQVAHTCRSPGSRRAPDAALVEGEHRDAGNDQAVPKRAEVPAVTAPDDRPGLASCLKALRDGDTLVVWKLDRLGRNLHHLVNTVHDLTARGVGLKVLTGQGAAIDTTTPAGKLVFGIFAALAEFERELISERTTAGLASARARGRKGGRPYKMTPAKLRLAAASMGQPDTKIGELCAELGVTRQTLYRHVSPTGELRPDGQKLLAAGSRTQR